MTEKTDWLSCLKNLIRMQLRSSQAEHLPALPHALYWAESPATLTAPISDTGSWGGWGYRRWSIERLGGHRRTRGLSTG